METVTTNGLRIRIESLLKTDKRLITEKGDLNYTKIHDLAENLDPDLIMLLLKNDIAKDAFFKSVLKSYVFNTKKFIEFLDFNSSNNSYSKYLGKEIGLYTGDELLVDRDEVVLNFPYKDCVLEGGQTTEEGMDTYYEYNETENKYEEKEEKRREIFYNEILARDEIDQLFEPKAFCNAVRYTKSGKKKFDTFVRDENGIIKDNLIIKGNNLLALHSIYKQFAGQVKLIYIDPPYNTGTGDDTFGYNDSFKRSTWLSFMKNRLEIAKELLRDDGAIYIQLDYHQVHYAKILLDEVFGESNFQREIIWRIGWLSGYKTTAENYIRNHDTILFYSKNQTEMNFNKLYIPNSEFKKPIPEKNESKFINALKELGINKKEAMNILSQVNEMPEKYPIDDVWNGSEYDDLNSIAIVSFAGETVSKLLSKDDQVKGQKTEKLIQRIISSHMNKGDIVLDFFGGTGTTAAVAHKMGMRYILCEQLDKHIDISLRRMQKVIAGDQSGISKAVGWNPETSEQAGSFVYLELAENNEKAIKEITACKSYDELAKLFKTLCEKYFLYYNVHINAFAQRTIKEKEFIALPLKKQKEMFARMLDLNQLYVNKSDMEDSQFGLSKEDIQMTNLFYGDK